MYSHWQLFHRMCILVEEKNGLFPQHWSLPAPLIQRTRKSKHDKRSSASRMDCGLAKTYSPHNSSPLMHPKWPQGYSKEHEKLVQLYCKVEPDDIELRELFATVYFIGGGLAFSNQEVRRYSSNRKGNILRRVCPPSTAVFEAADFYRSFEHNDIIDTLLASQSPPITQTTMSRSTRSRGRTDESVAGDDDDVTGADELLTASLRNMSMNVGTRSNR